MANKNKKNSFFLEIGVYMLFFFFYSVALKCFGYTETTFEGDLAIFVYYLVLNALTIPSVTVVMAFVARHKNSKS